MKLQIEQNNKIATEHPRMDTDAPWSEIYETAKKYPYNGLIDIEFDDEVKFVVNCLNDDAIALQYFWTGGQLTEPLSFNVWKTLAKRSRTTLDVGAYTGFYALIAGKASSSVVHAYEPVSFIYSRLAQNIMLNGLPNVKFVNKAVSDQSGTVEIGLRFGPKIFSSGSSIVDDIVRKATYSQPTHTVALDEVHKDEPVDLIKVDVEGAEEAVLKGAMALLSEKKPVLLLETRSTTHAQCMDIIKRKGFEHVDLEVSGGAYNSLIYHTSSYLYPEIEQFKAQRLFV